MARTITADAPMTIGWSNGIALQLSLPRRFIVLPSATSNRCGKSDRPADIAGIHDAVEQIGGDGAIGERRDRLARLGQIGISSRVEHRAVAARRRHPLRKLLGRHRIDGKVHVGKAVAAELRREPRIGAGMIRLQLKMRRHSRHGVDLAAELRHEEAVHDAGGGQLEADRRADRDDQLIDARDALLGIDEQPFPVERDDLDGDRLARARRSACADRGRARRPRRRRRPGAPSSRGSTRPAFRGGRNRRNPAGSGRAYWTRETRRRRPSVARIVGITIASMMPSELNRICRSAEAMGPCGSSTPSVQPPSVAAPIRIADSKMYRMLGPARAYPQ